MTKHMKILLTVRARTEALPAVVAWTVFMAMLLASPVFFVEVEFTIHRAGIWMNSALCTGRHPEYEANLYAECHGKAI